MLASGSLYPRWAPDFYLGYGYPYSNFYAPGAHIIASVLALSGLGVLRGVLIVQAFALVLYPTGAFLAARALYTACLPEAAQARGLVRPATIHLAALISAALYLYAPLRFHELFVQGNLSQWLALGLLPWCGWALTETARRGSSGWVGAAAALLAGLVYAHHPTAFMAYPLLAVYATTLAVIWRHNAGPSLSRRLRGVFGAFLLGLALSAPYWLPALTELRDVNIQSMQTGMFNMRLNALPLNEILALPRSQDLAALNPPQPHNLGIAQVALATVGGVLALWWWLRRGIQTSPPVADQTESNTLGSALLVVGALFIICIALILPVAAGFWDVVPLGNLIAFPWRLFGPALLWAVLLGGAVLFALPQRLQLPLTALLLALIPLSVAPLLFPRPFSPVEEPTTATVALYELQGGAPATASADEYRPRWVQDSDVPKLLTAALLTGKEPDRLIRDNLPEGATAQPMLLAPLEDVYHLDLPEPVEVQIGRFFFPGWRVWLDGRPVPGRPTGPHGLIGVTVPAGTHVLRLKFGDTPVRKVGWALMLAGLMALAWIVWNRRRPEQPQQNSRPTAIPRVDQRALITTFGVILLLSGAKTLVIEPFTRWFRPMSSVEAPATMQSPLHARFVNGIELIGYDLQDSTVRQGDTLAVRLYWRTLNRQTAASRPFLHLDSPDGKITWANQTKNHPGDKPTTSWFSDFYVVDEYQLKIPADAPPVLATLRVGLTDDGEQLTSLMGGENGVILRNVRITERHPLSAAAAPGHEEVYRLGGDIQLVGHLAEIVGDPPAARVTLYWRAGETPTENYTVFIHILDRDGKRIAEKDHQPVNARYPTSSWAPEQVIEDTHVVPLPAGAELQGLEVAIGLYRLSDGERLPATDSRGTRLEEDAILLPLPPGQ